MQFVQHTAQSLQLLPRQIAVPFDIVLSHGKLHCVEILRFVPGRRLVVSGIWREQPVVAKLFFHGNKANKDFHRELKGIAGLAHHGFLTPPLVHQEYIDSLYLLIFEKIESITLTEVVERTASALPVLQQATQLIASQHNVGLWQNDLHLNNYLVTAEQQIYTIDGADVCYNNTLSSTHALRNFALFLLQLPPDKTEWYPHLIQAYCARRGLTYNNSLQQQLTVYLNQANRYRQRKFLEKTLRDCTTTAIIETKQAFIAYDRSLDSAKWQEFLADPEAFFQQPDTVMLKDGNTCTVVAATVAGTRVVIKRYNVKSFWHSLSRLLRASRARWSWRNAHLLEYCGIKTAKPYALIEQYRWGLPRTAYYVTEYLTGQKVREYFSRDSITSDQQHVAHQLTQFFKKCIDLRLYHGDTKADNFIVAQDKLYVIDLDALRNYHSFITFSRVRYKDIQRFLKNWQLSPHIHTLFCQLFDEIGITPRGKSKGLS